MEPDLGLEKEHIPSSHSHDVEIKSSKDVPPECDEVLPYLFIGNLGFARSEEHVAKWGLTHILNLTRHSVSKGVLRRCVYSSIVLKDKSGQDIISHFSSAFQMIENVKGTKDGKIFVHCKAGVSRSCTIVVAYLMYAYKWSLKRAWFHVRSRRPVIHPNRGFINQLCEFERRLFPDITEPTLDLVQDIMFTVFERMEELHGPPLMDYCKNNPQCQYEIEALAKEKFKEVHGKTNPNICYDAGVSGKMHLHRVELYTRQDLHWLDPLIQSYLTSLQQRSLEQNNSN
mmetsp:Transcript_10416/g.19730  ORF Transcript_10416/g.19730 Transcript_10416/m.19730 type:complete len:285 (+) Transcript_10416:15-869(+)